MRNSIRRRWACSSHCLIRGAWFRPAATFVSIRLVVCLALVTVFFAIYRPRSRPPAYREGEPDLASLYVLLLIDKDPT